MAKTVDVIIPTYRPGEDFDKLIEMLVRQSAHPQSIIIMNSVENEGDCLEVKCEVPEDLIRIYNIPKSDFNHGHTRNEGVKHSTADYFVCMTQDAIPCDCNVLKVLTEAMSAGDADTGESSCADRSEDSGGLVAMAYARQVPKKNATEIESITRQFNYPDKDRVKTQSDLEEMGIKTFFASNVCCCYDRKVFDKLGGFVDRTDFNEDMMYGAKLIQAGYAIRYCAEAQVFHSHNYTARQQYERNRQLAISQALHPEYFGGIKSESEGVRLVKNTAAELVRDGKWYKVPELVYMSGAKYLGYRAGKRKGTE